MVSLVKGQKIDITKGNTGLKKITIGLGWDTNKYDGDNFDLDSSAFLLGSNGKVTDNKDFVFFNNLVHPSGSVKHMGDNLTGAGDGDDEQIIVNLPEVPSNIEKIAFAVTIYEADSRMQNFGMVSNAYIRVLQRHLWFLESCIAIMGNGNLMQLVLDILAVYRHFAMDMDYKGRKRKWQLV